MSSPRITNAEMYGLFAPHRPAPEAFGQGIEQRIAELEALAETAPAIDSSELAIESGLEAPSLLQKAAGLLPLTPSGKGLAGSGPLKAAYTLFALPGILFALVVGGFIASALSVLHISKRAVPAAHGPGRSFHPLEQPVNVDLKRSRWLFMLLYMTTLIALATSILTSGSSGQNILVLALLVAMGTLTLTVRGLMSQGWLSRYHVSRISTGLLSTVYISCFIWSGSFRIFQGDAWFSVGWCSIVILLGTIATQWLGQGRRAGTRTALGVLLMFFVVQPAGGTRSSAGSVYSQLSRTELQPNDLGHWHGAAAMYEALEAVGAKLPEMESTARAVASAIAAGEGLHPVILTAAARMGLVDEAHWSLLAARESESRALGNILRDNGYFNITAYYEYQFHMLLHSRELSSRERRQATQALEAAWKKQGSGAPLDQTVCFARALDLLGRADLVDAHRDQVHALLLKHWNPKNTGGLLRNQGGFSAHPSKSNYADARSTWSAIELMSRFGIPKGLDLWKVRTFLIEEARAYPLPIEFTMGHLRATPRAALLRLEGSLPLAPRGWLASLFAERLLLCSVLLVVLCLLAIRMAPPFPEGEGGGAQP